MHRWGIEVIIDVSGLTELPVIGIVYVFRVRRHCCAEERPQNGVCSREQDIRVNTKSALGWSGLTGLNHRSVKSAVQMYHGVNKIHLIASHPWNVLKMLDWLGLP